MEDPTFATLRTQQLRNHELLDTDQSVPDSEGGRAGASNRLSLCKIHHAVCDKNIQGINEVSRVEGRQDILEKIDGPMLKVGLQGLHHQKLYYTMKYN